MKKKYKSGLIITTLVVLACVFVSSYAVVGCGQRNLRRPYLGGQIYSATGYAPLIIRPGDHIINLTFYPYGDYYGNTPARGDYYGSTPARGDYYRGIPPHNSPIISKGISSSGSTNIEGELFLADNLGNSHLFGGQFGGFQYNLGYHPGAMRPYDNCSIPAGQYTVFTEYPAVMSGTSFSGYQLIAQGQGGITLLLTPTEPSFIAGFSNNTGRNPYVSMQVIVERANQYARGNVGGYHFPGQRYCSRYVVTFGAPPLAPGF